MLSVRNPHSKKVDLSPLSCLASSHVHFKCVSSSFLALVFSLFMLRCLILASLHIVFFKVCVTMRCLVHHNLEPLTYPIPIIATGGSKPVTLVLVRPISVHIRRSSDLIRKRSLCQSSLSVRVIHLLPPILPDLRTPKVFGLSESPTQYPRVLLCAKLTNPLALPF